MSSLQNELEWPEVRCNDYTASNGKTYKGCGQVVVMRKTGEKKPDGKPRYAKFNKDGSPHSHDASRQGTTRLDDVRPPASNPQAVTSVKVLETQFATFLTEFEGLKNRVKALEDAQIKKEADDMENASEDELGEEDVE
jgi:hypothetical protein